MSVSDYPDFLRVDQWVGSPFFNGVAFVTAAFVSGSLFVAPWEAISFKLNQTGGAATPLVLTLTFYDTPGGNIIDSVAYDCASNLQVADVIPVQSPYMTVGVSGYAGTRTIQLTVVPRRGFDPATRIFGASPLLEVFNLAVGAGVIVNAFLNPIVAAHCSWTVFTDAALWYSTLNHENAGGGGLSVVGAMSSAGNGRGDTLTVDLPPSTVRWYFQNQDGVAKTVWAACIALRS